MVIKKCIAVGLMVLLGEYISAQQLNTIDFQQVQAHITFDTLSQSISGKVKYIFDVGSQTDSLVLNASGMQFGNVKINGKTVAFKAENHQIILYQKLVKGEGQTLTLDYTAQPAKALYFTGWNSSAPGQIWTQGQGKDTSNWLPVVDDVRDKLTPEFFITFDSAFTVIANGQLIDTQPSGNQLIWHYALNRPVSSYLFALAVGKFQKQVQYSKSGVPIENYYETNDSDRVEPTYEESRPIFDFLESEIGVSYPFAIYRQVPVRDFLYAGMENATLTLFSDDLLIDSIAKNDKNFVNVSAHELAHHWFGNLVTAQSGKHHWLQEGFSTFYAWKAERTLLGDDAYFLRLYESYLALSLQSAGGKGEPVLVENGSSLTYYEKGAWALLYLEDLLGKNAFARVVKNFLNRYAYQTATTDDFLKEVTAVSSLDIEKFKKDWLESPEFNTETAKKLIDYKPVDALLQSEANETTEESQKRLINSHFSPLISKIAQKWSTSGDSRKVTLLKGFLKEADVADKRTVALALDSIPLALQSDFEALLQLHSYDAIEATLYKLWKFFPEKRTEYLEKTEGIYGHRNFNVRQLWLVLALVTDDFRPADKPGFYEELTAYTGDYFSYPIRQTAFQYLYDLQLIGPIYLDNLLSATRHWVWQFSKDAKEKLKNLILDPDYKNYYQQNLAKFKPAEQTYLKSLLSDKE